MSKILFENNSYHTLGMSMETAYSQLTGKMQYLYKNQQVLFVLDTDIRQYFFRINDSSVEKKRDPRNKLKLDRLHA